MRKREPLLNEPHYISMGVLGHRNPVPDVDRVSVD